jgi:hypothetical protein
MEQKQCQSCAGKTVRFGTDFVIPTWSPHHFVTSGSIEVRIACTIRWRDLIAQKTCAL